MWRLIAAEVLLLSCAQSETAKRERKSFHQSWGTTYLSHWCFWNIVGQFENTESPPEFVLSYHLGWRPEIPHYGVSDEREPICLNGFYQSRGTRLQLTLIIRLLSFYSHHQHTPVLASPMIFFVNIFMSFFKWIGPFIFCACVVRDRLEL